MADKKDAAAAAGATVRVRMRVSMAGVRIALSPGDTHECTAAEAERLKAAGFAEDLQG